jgi:hypothetical protein
MDTLILTSLLVLEYLRSPAKNLSHFFQAIWLIGNVFRGDFHGLPEAITGLEDRLCDGGVSLSPPIFFATLISILQIIFQNIP